MSLATDRIFIAALKSDAELLSMLGGTGTTQPRLYGIAIPMPDEDIDNVPVPYAIVTFDSLTNDVESKDDSYESDEDTVNIGIELTAKSLNELHTLTQKVRDTVLGYLQATSTNIVDYTFSADAIQYDSLKPCFWQVLRYQCQVTNS